jgi:hypothetical protein
MIPYGAIVPDIIHVLHDTDLYPISRQEFQQLERHGFITWLHQSLAPRINEPMHIKPKEPRNVLLPEKGRACRNTHDQTA